MEAECHSNQLISFFTGSRKLYTRHKDIVGCQQATSKQHRKWTQFCSKTICKCQSRYNTHNIPVLIIILYSFRIHQMFAQSQPSNITLQLLCTAMKRLLSPCPVKRKFSLVAVWGKYRISYELELRIWSVICVKSDKNSNKVLA